MSPRNFFTRKADRRQSKNLQEPYDRITVTTQSTEQYYGGHNSTSDVDKPSKTDTGTSFASSTASTTSSGSDSIASSEASAKGLDPDDLLRLHIKGPGSRYRNRREPEPKLVQAQIHKSCNNDNDDNRNKEKNSPVRLSIEVVLDEHRKKMKARDQSEAGNRGASRRQSSHGKGMTKDEETALARYTHSPKQQDTSPSGFAMGRLKMLNCFLMNEEKQQNDADCFGSAFPGQPDRYDFISNDADTYGEGNSLAASISVAEASPSSSKRSTRRRWRRLKKNNPRKNNADEIVTGGTKADEDESKASPTQNKENFKLSVTDIQEELERRDTLADLPEKHFLLCEQRQQQPVQSQSLPSSQTSEKEKSSTSPLKDVLLLTKNESPSSSLKKPKELKSLPPSSSSVISSLTMDTDLRRHDDAQLQQQKNKGITQAQLEREHKFRSESTTSTEPSVIITGSNKEGFQQRISETTSVVQCGTTSWRSSQSKTKKSSARRKSKGMNRNLGQHSTDSAAWMIHHILGGSETNAMARRPTRKSFPVNPDDYSTATPTSNGTGDYSTAYDKSVLTGNSGTNSVSSNTTTSLVNVAEMVARRRQLRKEAEGVQIVPRCHFCGGGHWIYNCPHMNAVDERYWCNNLLGDESDTEIDDSTIGTRTTSAGFEIGDDDGEVTTQMLMVNPNFRCNTDSALNCFKSE
ncbi:unnamed protein product [Pseudo-nitzschia multistriata]|uniref:Uncharacterized protein n=1 Tax=Pseudo-nitzschia multistriata TaxID=183589 RepID=A0A448Z340_9STRA|nr:unnamed protein product [Pseudo-nitzschia multistriata]